MDSNVYPLSGLRLQAVRRKLFLSTVEAASFFPNCTAHAWEAMESGQIETPNQVTERLNRILEWRNAQMVIIEAGMSVQLGQDGILDFWHESMDDWMSIDGREPEHFRAMQSLQADWALNHPSRVTLVRFDRVDFTRWLVGRHPTEERQAEYLYTFASPISDRPY